MPVLGGHDLRQLHVAFRSFAQFEVRRASLLDADIEDGFPRVPNCFEVLFDHACYSVDPLLSVALGGRQRVALLGAQRLANGSLLRFMEPIKIQNVDTWRLREGQSRKAQK